MNQNENSSPKRENFASRLGFLLVSAGCAIGIGNVWRFPYGRGAERRRRIRAVLSDLPAGDGRSRADHGAGCRPRGSRNGDAGVSARWKSRARSGICTADLCLFGCCMLMMYYTTVSGWMLSYFFKFLTGAFSGLSGDAVSGVFGRMLESPGEMGGYMALTVVLGFAICSFGLQNGVERITKGMMCALIVLIAVLAVHSFTLSGAKDGLAFLPSARLEPRRGAGNRQRSRFSDESGVLHAQPRHRRDGNLRQLHEPRPYADRRGRAHLRAGYVRGGHARV